MEIYFDISVTPWGKGGFATIFSDITARKMGEKERENLLKELERKNKELESIVYVASHDLRSPLINIQGFSQRLENSMKDLERNLNCMKISPEISQEIFPLIEERIPSALKFIQASGNKMDGLIKGLLKLSRAGRTSLQFKKIDMNNLLENILFSMAFQIEKSGAVIEVEILPFCYGDINQINQVFSNLIDNAIKYKHSERKPVVKINGFMEKDRIIYTVSDNGIGISSDYKDKIWDLFYRLSHDKTIPGEGIGLTLAKRIVERHNGKIWFEGEDGKGSRFYVELPVGSEK
jgi:light-regulated signal transduction histidine kinase (bacteriophytochrome)